MATLDQYHLATAPRPEPYRSLGSSGAEAPLNAVFSQAGAGFAQCDTHGRFFFVNDGYCALVGRSRDELLQRTEAVALADRVVTLSRPPARIVGDRENARARAPE